LVDNGQALLTVNDNQMCLFLSLKDGKTSADWRTRLADL